MDLNELMHTTLEHHFEFLDFRFDGWSDGSYTHNETPSNRVTFEPEGDGETLMIIETEKSEVTLHIKGVGEFAVFQEFTDKLDGVGIEFYDGNEDEFENMVKGRIPERNYKFDVLSDKIAELLSDIYA